MTFHIITLFPEAFRSYLDTSILARAIKAKKVGVKFYNPYDFLPAKKRADDRPFGGGPGMVMRAEPILKAVEKAVYNLKPKTYKLIIFSPGGKQFTNQLAEKWSRRVGDLILICGRYEGIDARVKKILRACLPRGMAEEISVGPYVLTGGELPALAVLDGVTRRLPGVLGKDESVEERRVASPAVYTRPEILEYRGKKYRVPKVLLSGHRAKIELWKTRSGKSSGVVV